MKQWIVVWFGDEGGQLETTAKGDNPKAAVRTYWPEAKLYSSDLNTQTTVWKVEDGLVSCMFLAEL